MIFPSNRVRIVVATKPVDFRSQHDGQAGRAEQATQEEVARIGEPPIMSHPAIFSNKVYVSPMPGNAKISFREARRASGEDLESAARGGVPATLRSRRPASPPRVDTESGRNAARALRRLDAPSYTMIATLERSGPRASLIHAFIPRTNLAALRCVIWRPLMTRNASRQVLSDVVTESRTAF